MMRIFNICLKMSKQIEGIAKARISYYCRKKL